MPEPERRKVRRSSPCFFAAFSLRSSSRASYSACCGDWGGGTNSSFDATRDGIGSGASASASSSHWRIHMGRLLRRGAACGFAEREAASGLGISLLLPHHVHPAVLHLVPGL